MTVSGRESPAALPDPRGSGRRIGAYRGSEPGPLLLCISGLHGNEPAGPLALERVLAGLEAGGYRLRGDLVGLRGNLSAAARGQRFIDEDLNRVWQPKRVAAILASVRAEDAARRDQAEEGAGRMPAPAPGTLPMVGSAELGEQRELLAAIRDVVREARGQVYVLDLHTTSSESVPFTTLGDTLQNRRLALRLPIPVVLGLEEQIDGPMLQYFDRLGWRSVGIEGGQHGSEAAVQAHEDAVWLLLGDLGLLDPSETAGLDARRDRLARASHGLPRVVDVRYRHRITERDRFRMRPGFENFERVRTGQALGEDARGVVQAPRSGRIFMPLYQKQGDDGFFIVHRVHPVWLTISRWLRRAGADRWATWIPGVHPHPDRDDAVVLARWARNRAVIGLLHLLGFKARRRRRHLLMIRRVESETPDPALDPRL